MNPDLELLNYWNSSPFYAGFDLEDPTSRSVFLEKFMALPASRQDLLTSTETADYLFNLSRQLNLSPEQLILLALVVRYTVVGDLSIGGVTELIMTSLGIEAASAQILFDKLSQDILSQPDHVNTPDPSYESKAAPARSLHEQNMATGSNINRGNVIDLRNNK